jgi:hypothetical protein
MEGETAMCRFCVGNLFTNKSLFSGWSSPEVDAPFREGPSRRSFMALAGAAAGATGLGFPGGLAFADTSATADMIFQGGTIIPLAASGATPVEALAVRGGQIVAVGTASDIAGLKGDATKVIDLAGRTLCRASSTRTSIRASSPSSPSSLPTSATPPTRRARN